MRKYKNIDSIIPMKRNLQSQITFSSLQQVEYEPLSTLTPSLFPGSSQWFPGVMHMSIFISLPLFIFLCFSQRSIQQLQIGVPLRGQECLLQYFESSPSLFLVVLSCEKTFSNLFPQAVSIYPNSWGTF